MAGSTAHSEIGHLHDVFFVKTRTIGNDRFGHDDCNDNRNDKSCLGKVDKLSVADFDQSVKTRLKR